MPASTRQARTLSRSCIRTRMYSNPTFRECARFQSCVCTCTVRSFDVRGSTRDSGRQYWCHSPHKGERFSFSTDWGFLKLDFSESAPLHESFRQKTSVVECAIHRSTVQTDNCSWMDHQAFRNKKTKNKVAHMRTTNLWCVSASASSW